MAAESLFWGKHFMPVLLQGSALVGGRRNARDAMDHVKPVARSSR